MAGPEQLSGMNGWRFHVPVFFGILAGAFLILTAETVGRAAAIPAPAHDAILIIGGFLVGLVVLSIDELARLGPERARLRRERQAELARHQEERRLDFEQYRALQAELRETRSRTTALQTKLDLTGALDRDRIGDALLLGFYFHRRGEGLPSSPKQSIFKTAAMRLKLLTETVTAVKLEKPALRDVLEIAYGPVVAEAFDLGSVLSQLGEDGLAKGHDTEILGELEKQLKVLKFDSKGSTDGRTNNVSGMRKLAERVASMIRRI